MQHLPLASFTWPLCVLLPLSITASFLFLCVTSRLHYLRLQIETRSSLCLWRDSSISVYQVNYSSTNVLQALSNLSVQRQVHKAALETMPLHSATPWLTNPLSNPAVTILQANRVCVHLCASFMKLKLGFTYYTGHKTSTSYALGGLMLAKNAMRI